MLNQSNDKINADFETDLYKIIKIEIESIKFNLSLQKHMHDTILSVSDNLWNKLNISSDLDFIHSTSKDLYDISNICFQLQSNINCLEKLETKLESLELTNSIDPNNNFFDKLNNYREECLTLLNQSEDFNSSFNELIKKFYEVYTIDSITNCISNNENTEEDNIADCNNITDDNKNIDDKDKEILSIPDNFKENTLVISNTEVVLPFTKNDLDEKLKTSKYSSYEEIINTVYTKPIKYFEPTVISRFKETYSLIINKEHGSKLQAISLSLELATNYNLHPAIIASCNNLTQLDVYLSCLEYNELADFHFFDIVYNIPPVPKKHLFKKSLENINKVYKEPKTIK